ncbi:MAG: hypothetical protein Hyperionvirus3_111 [Hyperionvirus sp.]|uniref:Uncharacterized protein n=1 Tax=Hyperionvirus sp. TaxID=2487770 RepID=A0A3G5A6U7_9VIRU|nr:MAG: hypothetical protein Hyperionvirus3_111 [Hyperionvirus sp.]
MKKICDCGHSTLDCTKCNTNYDLLSLDAIMPNDYEWQNVNENYNENINYDIIPYHSIRSESETNFCDNCSDDINENYRELIMINNSQIFLNPFGPTIIPPNATDYYELRSSYPIRWPSTTLSPIPLTNSVRTQYTSFWNGRPRVIIQNAGGQNIAVLFFIIFDNIPFSEEHYYLDIKVSYFFYNINGTLGTPYFAAINVYTQSTSSDVPNRQSAVEYPTHGTPPHVLADTTRTIRCYPNDLLFITNEWIDRVSWKMAKEGSPPYVNNDLFFFYISLA